MTVRLLFASGDVGGARALYPVAELATRLGHSVHVVWHGHIATMKPITDASQHAVDPATDSDEWLRQLIAEVQPEAVVFATSMHDTLALRLARHAQGTGVPVAHLLDNWTSHRQRLELGEDLVRPDLYAVMDGVAADDVLKAGFAADTVRVTGTPALSTLSDAGPMLPDADGLRLVFVSEPVADDQGNDPASPRYRGYVETTALSLLAQAMSGQAMVARLDILPHPRENVTRLNASWQALRGDLVGDLIPPDGRNAALSSAHAIVGMSSILLYEMWLRGWPVASLQPGLLLPELRMLQRKPGLTFIDDLASAPDQLRRWKEEIVTYRPSEETVMECSRHKNAAEAFLAAVGELVANRSGAQT